MSATYELLYLTDLLKVPLEKREECVREVLYSLALTDLALGELASSFKPSPMFWTDDDNKSCELRVNGETVLSLAVTPTEP